MLLDVEELNLTLEALIRACQNDTFKDEIQSIIMNKLSSSLLSFVPFLDIKNIFGVGDRLRHSEFCFNKKHPFLLYSKNFFKLLIMRKCNYLY